MIDLLLAFALRITPVNQTIALSRSAHITAIVTGYSDMFHCGWSASSAATFGTGTLRSPALPPGMILPAGCPVTGGGAERAEISTDVSFAKQGTYTVVFSATDAFGMRLAVTSVVKVNKR